MFRKVPLSINRSFPLYTAILCFTGLLCIQRKTPDDGQRNCPKHVEFYSKNKIEKLVHLVDFIIRIFHDALSPERKILTHSLPHRIHFFHDPTTPSGPWSPHYRGFTITQYILKL